ncbi:putative 26S proteasome regulatory subunit S3 [Fasciola hepatica]|uniref:26S proteasome regulatory subunit S3 n=1 Tax=Fasciola hepatica TaxID=6192 RepID=A0A4E0RR69_FASHE|nr:putative 26S proteasome regulatory subunit S3 [Fasciola hepatica]
MMTGGALGNFVSAVTKTGGAFNFLFDLVEKSQDLLLKNALSLDPIFESFDCEKYTCLHAAILRAKYLCPTSVNKEVIFNQTNTFFEHCNVEHARKIPVYMRSISAEYCSMLISLGAAIRGIQPIITIIRRFQLTSDCFTPFHTDLCQLSLSARVFNPVLPILDSEILEVHKNNSDLDLKDYLLYFYYGGMIYAALKNWDRGLHFLEVCLTMPAHLSCVQLEAAKKVILLSLIHHGKFMTVLDAPTPHFTTPKPWKRYCKPYLALATAFHSNNPEELSTSIERHRDAFIADDNFGLVKQVMKNHVKFRIASLTKVSVSV